jgi:catechol 2,3-dioxygenase-like lactoylglutathione lyase family enzyme
LLLLAATVPAEPLVRAVDSITIPVADLDRSVKFFTEVLEFELVDQLEAAGPELERLRAVHGARLRIARLRLGDQRIELDEYLAPAGQPIPVDSRSNDLWFQHIAIVVSDMQRAYERLRAHDVAHASTGPQRLPDWNPNAGGIQAFYFKDPDGHALEVIWFPPGKGDPRWQRPTERLFLGIDHTAIAIGDTEAGLRFYRDLLGLEVAGGAENYGIEQEHLNNVFGARLRITALKAAAGPGIEFLEYLAPTDGRPAPVTKRSNDLIAWITTLAVGDADAAAAAVRSAGFKWMSPGAVSLPGPELGFSKAVLVKDPDAHFVQLIEESNR